MSRGNTRREVKANATETASPILIDSAAFGKEDSLHILHVDDDASFLLFSKIPLEKENKFEIDTATCVDEALDKLKTQHYDAVVSDYTMPLKTGLDFLKELREQKNNIPFIIFAGRCKEEVAIKALNLGADRYIKKSGSPDVVYCELGDAINKIVERKKTKSLQTNATIIQNLFIV